MARTVGDIFVMAHSVGDIFAMAHSVGDVFVYVGYDWEELSGTCIVYVSLASYETIKFGTESVSAEISINCSSGNSDTCRDPQMPAYNVCDVACRKGLFSKKTFLQ